jgi:hypothetical protein
MKHFLLNSFRLALFLAGIVCTAQTTVYQADFSTAGGFTHSTSNPPAAAPAMFDGGNYTIGYDTTPGTDGSDNTFRSDGTNLVSADFGGPAYFETDAIDISAFTSISIEGLASTLGSSVFNGSDEQFQWSYSIDGTTNVDGPAITTDGNLDTPAEWASIATNGGSSVTVRFEFNVNGAGDGFTVTQVQVQGSTAAANPGPSITDVLQSPPNGDNIDSSTQVTVSATVTDDDGIGSVVLNYDVADTGTDFDGTYNSSLTMTADGDSYSAIIPEQANNTVVYYQITATDAATDPASSESLQFSYNVQDPIDAPDLIFTEISDPGDNANARFVEIYNNGTETIDFSTTPVYIARFTNGNPDPTPSNVEDLEGTLAPGAFLVIAASGTNFESEYGFAPDQVNGGFAVNGDDPFGMYVGSFDTGTLFDVYGVPGVDGSGQAWEYENSRAVRNDLTVAPKTTWTASEWDITAADAVDATPGRDEGGITYTYDAGAWSPQNPEGNSTNIDLVVVQSGTATLSADVTAFQVSIVAGATLDIAGNELNLERNLTNNGSFQGADGTINFNGTGAATINGNDLTVGSLSLDNPGGLSLETGVSVASTVTLTAGVLNTNDQLTFLSDASSSAILAEVVSGSISGNVSVEQFYPANRAFRFIASPVNMDGSIFENWQQNGLEQGDAGFEAGAGVQITGGIAADGFDQSSSNNPSALVFDNSYNYGGATDAAARQTIDNGQFRFLSTDNGDATNSISPVAGQPFNILIRGDRTTDLFATNEPATATTLTSTGTLAVGNQDVVLGDAATLSDETFAFVGNPYQAQVDLGLTLAASEDVNANFYFYYLPTTEQYETVTLPVASGTTATELIQPGQAFFVQLDPDGDTQDPTVSFSESHKSDATQTTATYSEPQSRIAVNLLNEQDNDRGLKRDRLVLDFATDGNNEIDAMDARKLRGSNEQLLVKSNQFDLSIERRALPEDQESIVLILENLEEATYSFDIDLTGFNEILVYLEDRQENSLTLLETGQENLISFNSTNSMQEDRFNLKFSKSTLGVGDDIAFAKAVTLYPNPSDNGTVTLNNLIAGQPVQITMYNTLGQVVLQQSIEQARETETVKNLENLGNGLYLVQILQNDKDTSLKLILN